MGIRVSSASVGEHVSAMKRLSVIVHEIDDMNLRLNENIKNFKV